MAPATIPLGAPLFLLLGPVFLAVVAAVIGLGPVARRARCTSEAIRRWRIDGGDLPVDNSTDEIGELTRAFSDTAADLLEREKSLREFVANTTHDMATPLTVLQGHLASLGDTLVNNERLRKAHEEAQYMGALLGNLTVRTKLDANQLVRETVDLGAIVAGVERRLGAVARTHNATLAAAWPDREVLVIGDPILIERAISNLVVNAIIHGRKEGNVALLLRSRDIYFSMTVKDDGPGMTFEKIRQTTEIRASIDEKKARPVSRCGLGLKIAADVFRAHGWQLGMRDNQPKGLLVEIRGELSGQQEVRYAKPTKGE